MSQLLSQLSDSIALLVANAAPLLTAIRIGANRHVSGFLWRSDLIVTTDQALPAAASYTIVLSTGALLFAHPGPRDPGLNLACLRLDVPVTVALAEPARSATIGALVLVLGANFDGSPTVRLTSIHGFPRSPRGGAAAAITLDLAGERVSHGGMVLDAAGLLLGMASATAEGDGTVVPHGVIARFVAAEMKGTEASARVSPAVTLPTVERVPQASVPPAGNGPEALGARRGWLGVSLQPITVPDNLAHRAGQRTARQVVSVSRGGPADRAGLRAGDVLLALDGSSTSGNRALRAFLASERIGNEVEVRLMRDGLIHTTILTIAAQPDG
jgi:S1-C subfamily serine protease